MGTSGDLMDGQKKEYDFMIPISYSHDDELFCPRLGEELEKRGYSVFFLTTTKYGDNAIEAEGHAYINIDKISKDFKNINFKEEARRIVTKYHLTNIQKLYFGEKIYLYSKKKKEELYEKTIRYILALENFFDEYSFKYIIHDQGVEIIRRALDIVGTSREIPNIFIQLSPIYMKSFFFRSTSLRLEGELKPINELPKEELESARKYLEEFKSQKGRLYPYFNYKIPIFNAYKKFLRRYFTYSRMGIHFWEGAEIMLSKLIKKLLCRIIYPSLNQSEKLCENEKYIFFPIQFYLESRTTVFSPNWFRQQFAVDIIARSLPEDYKLFIKDHPEWIGYLPLESIRFMRKLDNIKFLNPHLSNHFIIENSDAVITINGSTAYEAVLYGKPTIVLGREFYADRGLTIDVRDISTIDEILSNAINSKPVPNDLIIPFINLILRNSFEGVWGLLDEANVKCLSDSIIRYCSQHMD